MEPSSLITILVISIGILAVVVIFELIFKKDKGVPRLIGQCLNLKSCKVGKDCESDEVCYDGLCIKRRMCKTEIPGHTPVQCTDKEKCYIAGGVGYCVPLQFKL